MLIPLRSIRTSQAGLGKEKGYFKMKRLTNCIRYLKFSCIFIVLGIGVLLISCGSKTYPEDHPSSEVVMKFFNAWINHDWDIMRTSLINDNPQQLDAFIDRLKSSLVRCASVKLLDLKIEKDSTARAKVEIEITDLPSVYGSCGIMMVARLMLREQSDARKNDEILKFYNLRKAFSPNKCGFETFVRRTETVLILKQADGWKIDARTEPISALKYAAIGGTLGASVEDAEKYGRPPGSVGPPSRNIDLANMSLGFSLETNAMGKSLGLSQRQIDTALEEGAKKSKTWKRENYSRAIETLRKRYGE